MAEREEGAINDDAGRTQVFGVRETNFHSRRFRRVERISICDYITFPPQGMQNERLYCEACHSKEVTFGSCNSWSKAVRYK